MDHYGKDHGVDHYGMDHGVDHYGMDHGVDHYGMVLNLLHMLYTSSVNPHKKLL